MPSTLVAFRTHSAPISMARRAAAVSVVKYGLPVPAAKMTTRPSPGAAWRGADEGLGDLGHLDAAHHPRLDAELLQRVLQARALITVASMPM
jgi:hypothetical protein